MAGRTSAPGQSVTGRVLSILAVFELSPSARSLSEIAAESGLPQSTAHRLLGELEEWGAVQRDARGRYQIGLRLWELGQHAGRQLRDVVRPFLQDLFGLTQETAHFAIRDGADVLYIDRVYGTRRVPHGNSVQDGVGTDLDQKWSSPSQQSKQNATCLIISFTAQALENAEIGITSTFQPSRQRSHASLVADNLCFEHG